MLLSGEGYDGIVAHPLPDCRFPVLKTHVSAWEKEKV